MRARNYLPSILCLTYALAAAQAAGAQVTNSARHNLMPVPASAQFNAGRLRVTKSFAVAARGYADERLRAGIERAVRRLEGRTVMELPRGLSADAATAALVVECRAAGRAVPAVGEDESYSLEVTERQAVLTAPTVVGALRGLETFLQLVEGDAAGFYVPAVSIRDKPRFPWRGLMMDVARHYQPVEVIKRNLDAMAAV